jgi:hypothetical protein
MGISIAVIAAETAGLTTSGPGGIGPHARPHPAARLPRPASPTRGRDPSGRAYCAGRLGLTRRRGPASPSWWGLGIGRWSCFP